MEDQAQEIFSSIRNTLHSQTANILQERVFGTKAIMGIIADIRAREYGDIDDGVAPSFLVCSEGARGPIAGVQVHALASDSRPQIVKLDRRSCGRIVYLPGCTYVTLSGVSGREYRLAPEQARAMLEKSEAALAQFSGDMLCVPRTWMWLDDILAWYHDFNLVRNAFFTERGVIGEGTSQSMPASTGIGLGPADGGKCSMDLVAVLEPRDSIQYVKAAGKQRSAFEYGSAFSRASQAISPAGQTIFISGTASIDTSGATTNIGDTAGQINATIENACAVLREMDWGDDEVVQATAYCKTSEVEGIFGELRNDLPWPWVTMICDVCRSDLLFEVEATALRRK